MADYMEVIRNINLSYVSLILFLIYFYSSILQFIIFLTKFKMIIILYFAGYNSLINCYNIIIKIIKYIFYWFTGLYSFIASISSNILITFISFLISLSISLSIIYGIIKLVFIIAKILLNKYDIISLIIFIIIHNIPNKNNKINEISEINIEATKKKSKLSFWKKLKLHFFPGKKPKVEVQPEKPPSNIIVTKIKQFFFNFMDCLSMCVKKLKAKIDIILLIAFCILVVLLSLMIYIIPLVIILFVISYFILPKLETLFLNRKLFSIKISIILLILGVIIYFLKNQKEAKFIIKRLKKFFNNIFIFKTIKHKIVTAFDFEFKNDKNLLESCLLEDKSDKYRQFIDIINNFERNDFYKLFKGQLNTDNDFKIIKLCYKYNINDIDNFKLLILKIQNFQFILCEWCKDKTKHIYLRKLWKLYPNIYELKNLTDEKLEIELNEIGYSNWNEEDKKTFKSCINNSEEIKALKYSTFIPHDIKKLIENCIKYKNAFKKLKNMGTYENKFYKYIREFVKGVLEAKEKTFNFYYGANIILNSRTIDCVIKNCTNNININEGYGYYFNEIVNLMKNEKVKNFINSSTELFNKIDLVFSFFDLSYHVIELIKCFAGLEYTENEIYNQELMRIKINFEKHKDEIKVLSGYDKYDLELIESILSKINKDRDDIDNLIRNIENEKKYEELERKNNIKKIIFNSIKVVVGVSLGAIISGGFAPVISTVATTTGIIRVIETGVKYSINTKKIKELKDLLEKSKEEQKRIDKEIKEIKKIYCERLVAHSPDNIQKLVLEKYLK